jgi:hypothetical protein
MRRSRCDRLLASPARKETIFASFASLEILDKHIEFCYNYNY